MAGPRAEDGITGVLEAGGRVGRDLLDVDWAATPLGPPASWPQSLTSMVGVLVGSRFSMWMAWGPELTFFCNDAYRRDTLGEKYPWALGRPASEVWAEIWPEVGPRVETVMSTGEATWDEALMLFLERSGYTEETYHTFSYSPLRDDDGSIAGMLCVVSEDTERVIGERRLRTLRDLGADAASLRTEPEFLEIASRTLARSDQSLPFALVYLLEEDGRTVRLAASAGMPAGHGAAPPSLDPFDAAAVWPAGDALDGRLTIVDDLPGRFADLPSGGWSEPPLQAALVPLQQQGTTRPVGFLVTALNRYGAFDDDYRAFVTLVAGHLGAGLSSARAYDAERARAEALAELDRAKTAFFTNVSHELRTPLTLMLGPAEDALADADAPLAPDQRRRVEVVARNGQRMLKLVNTLLDFSRVESSAESARFEPVDLARYTNELASMFESATTRAGLTLDVQTADIGEPVFVDHEMWAKIVFNLLSNALKHTWEGGITVRVDGDGERARLAVTDTGIGIEPAEQTRLFDRFHRVLGARSRSHEGSGIGLALVAELSALHGGSVGVTSTPGRGSTFTVSVPLGTRHLPEAQVIAEPAESIAVERHAEDFVTEALRWLEAAPDGAASSARGTDRPRVLVVDDNRDMREYVATLLSADYAVETAPDGAAALELARADPPDLVLTDVMMPELDGFGLLAALREAPETRDVPVVMLSARAGDEGLLEGLEAGADDYLVKPFAARELLARVRANLELDRVRHTRDRLERSQALLDQAQRLAGVGSWELDWTTGAIHASDEFLRQLEVEREDLEVGGFEKVLSTRVHPHDLARVRGLIEQAAETGVPLDYETRIVLPSGSQRLMRTIAEVDRDTEHGTVRLSGANQDITEQRDAEYAVAHAAAAREASERERRIADELQRSLLPERTFQPDGLDVATFYRAGVAGTQVGGDWYDVVELGAGRAALVIGDVMGRGVKAAAVMGQVRTAVRAYARMDLPPADVLELLDGVVTDLDADQIVTCLYGIYDPADRTLVLANAGHLPPLLLAPGQPTRRLTRAAGPPLGAGPFSLREERLQLDVGSVLAFYTDGLVERRDSDLDTGIDALAERLSELGTDVLTRPAHLVDVLLPDAQDDDVAVLVARVPEGADQATVALRDIVAEPRSVGDARHFVSDALVGWDVSPDVIGTAVLLVSELMTNAVVHAAPPVELRLRRTADELVIEVYDGAAFLPRKRRPEPDDENGRGLQLVALLADRWGTRPLQDGKAVWCVLSLRR